MLICENIRTLYVRITDTSQTGSKHNVKFLFVYRRNCQYAGVIWIQNCN